MDDTALALLLLCYNAQWMYIDKNMYLQIARVIFHCNHTWLWQILALYFNLSLLIEGPVRAFSLSASF